MNQPEFTASTESPVDPPNQRVIPPIVLNFRKKSEVLDHLLIQVYRMARIPTIVFCFFARKHHTLPVCSESCIDSSDLLVVRQAFPLSVSLLKLYIYRLSIWRDIHLPHPVVVSGHSASPVHQKLVSPFRIGSRVLGMQRKIGRLKSAVPHSRLLVCGATRMRTKQ